MAWNYKFAGERPGAQVPKAAQCPRSGSNAAAFDPKFWDQQPGSLNPDNIGQGAVGNCYAYAVLINFAKFGWITPIPQLSPIAIYEVPFFTERGGWMPLLIDDRIAHPSLPWQGRLQVMALDTKQSATIVLWLKALAMAEGTMKQFEGGIPEYVILPLGGPPDPNHPKQLGAYGVWTLDRGLRRGIAEYSKFVYAGGDSFAQRMKGRVTRNLQGRKDELTDPQQCSWFMDTRHVIQFLVETRFRHAWRNFLRAGAWQTLTKEESRGFACGEIYLEANRAKIATAADWKEYESGFANSGADPGLCLDVLWALFLRHENYLRGTDKEYQELAKPYSSGAGEQPASSSFYEMMKRNMTHEPEDDFEVDEDGEEANRLKALAFFQRCDGCGGEGADDGCCGAARMEAGKNFVPSGSIFGLRPGGEMANTILTNNDWLQSLRAKAGKEQGLGNGCTEDGQWTSITETGELKTEPDGVCKCVMSSANDEAANMHICALLSFYCVAHHTKQIGEEGAKQISCDDLPTSAKKMEDDLRIFAKEDDEGSDPVKVGANNKVEGEKGKLLRDLIVYSRKSRLHPVTGGLPAGSPDITDSKGSCFFWKLHQRLAINSEYRKYDGRNHYGGLAVYGKSDSHATYNNIVMGHAFSVDFVTTLAFHLRAKATSPEFVDVLLVNVLALRNPWGRKELAGGFSLSQGDQGSGHWQPSPRDPEVGAVDVLIWSLNRWGFESLKKPNSEKYRNFNPGAYHNKDTTKTQWPKRGTEWVPSFSGDIFAIDDKAWENEGIKVFQLDEQCGWIQGPKQMKESASAHFLNKGMPAAKWLKEIQERQDAMLARIPAHCLDMGLEPFESSAFKSWDWVPFSELEKTVRYEESASHMTVSVAPVPAKHWSLYGEGTQIGVGVFPLEVDGNRVPALQSDAGLQSAPSQPEAEAVQAISKGVDAAAEVAAIDENDDGASQGSGNVGY
ncbi:unnamed protein product [Amoebophrya sp. A25]|nr:unnamed protein product [Amoebophrya sp. A25]|eukprot:GSA25T00027171001.1